MTHVIHAAHQTHPAHPTQTRLPRWLLIALLVLLGLPAAAFAQVTATPTSKLEFDLVGQSVAVAGAASYKGYVDGGTTGTALTGLSCVANAAIVVGANPPAAGATCKTSYPSMTPGTHDLTVTQTISGQEGSKSAPPLSVTFVVVVTPVNVRNSGS